MLTMKRGFEDGIRKTVWVDGTTKLNAENLNHIEAALK